MQLSLLQLEPLVKAALLEDLGQGDLTTDALLGAAGEDPWGEAEIRTRQAAVVSGLEAADLVFRLVDTRLQVQRLVVPGSPCQPGEVLATVSGPLSSILKAERTALNFLQHLSGIATETARYVQALAGTTTRVTDTRKTTPGLRLLEKKAVLDGGGSSHRYNLGSAVMLKDNHLSAFVEGQRPLEEVVPALRKFLPHTTRIEVEVETLEQVQKAVEAQADIILLDNMGVELVQEAVALIANRAITEVSGGITLETLRSYAETGVDYISTSKITLGAPAVDIGMDFSLRPPQTPPVSQALSSLKGDPL
jgi:nicotinate-nucleotide pyrophosphorylase (carboxylating)